MNQVLKDNLPALSAMYEDQINNAHDVEIQLESIIALSIITSPTYSSVEKCEVFGNILVNKSLTITNQTVRYVVYFCNCSYLLCKTSASKFPFLKIEDW